MHKNEMKRGAITTLPGLREALIVSKKRMHSNRVTSRLLSTRSIRLKRCSTTAKDDRHYGVLRRDISFPFCSTYEEERTLSRHS